MPLILFTFFLTYVASAAPQSPHRGSVELHAHLFMDRGLPLLVRGDFFDELKAESSDDKYSSQTNPKTLNESGISILVVSLYAHPVFSPFSMRGTIREQIELTHRFIRENPQWTLAKNASEAEKALKNGKQVIVLSLEGASGIIENEEDIQEFVVEKGIRIVTLLHLTDDQYGGVALLPGFKALASPISWLKQIFSPHSHDGVRTNHLGLSDRGRWLAQRLIDAGVWIDLAHASDKSIAELKPLLDQAKQPHLYTHSVLRSHMQSERALSEAQLNDVIRSGGVIGLMPGEHYLENTVVPQAYCDGCSNERCQDSFHRFLTHYNDLAKVFPAESIMLGSDFNGTIKHILPTCGTQTSMDQTGYWNPSHVPTFWQALRNKGAKLPARVSQQANAFVRAWKRVDSHNKIRP